MWKSWENFYPWTYFIFIDLRYNRDHDYDNFLLDTRVRKDENTENHLDIRVKKDSHLSQCSISNLVLRGTKWNVNILCSSLHVFGTWGWFSHGKWFLRYTKYWPNVHVLTFSILQISETNVYFTVVYSWKRRAVAVYWLKIKQRSWLW